MPWNGHLASVQSKTRTRVINYSSCVLNHSLQKTSKQMLWFPSRVLKPIFLWPLERAEASLAPCGGFDPAQRAGLGAFPTSLRLWSPQRKKPRSCRCVCAGGGSPEKHLVSRSPSTSGTPGVGISRLQDSVGTRQAWPELSTLQSVVAPWQCTSPRNAAVSGGIWSLLPFLLHLTAKQN